MRVKGRAMRVMRVTVKMLRIFICNIYKKTPDRKPRTLPRTNSYSQENMELKQSFQTDEILSNLFASPRRFWMKLTKNVHKKSVTYIELMIFQVVKDDSRQFWRTKSDLEGSRVVKAFTVSWWVQSYLKTSLCHSGGEFRRKTCLREETTTCSSQQTDRVLITLIH